MDVDPAYTYIGKFGVAVQRFMMGSRRFISKISFLFKNENGGLVFFEGQSITFRLSIREVEFQLII